MIDAPGFAGRGWCNGHVARPKPEVTARRSIVFQHYVAEQATIKRHGLVNVSHG
jgi:hypothetical protein